MELTIGDNISYLLKQKNLTLSQLAMLMEVPAELVGKWVSGKVLPHLYYLIKIADIFEIRLDELIRADMENEVLTIR
jgi:transcriptional regulator with XRE-family HTH domain